MADLKCKMCGASLNVKNGENIVICDSCGARQTIPVTGDDKKTAAFDRANRLRAKGEFDKAIKIYEGTITDYPEEPEGYWGMCLCKYGVMYLDIPEIGDRIPVCMRASFDNLMYDPDFEMVMEYADSEARALYRYEAKQIEELRREIIEKSGKEKPKDIFICCCETDEHGKKTPEFSIAEGVYKALKKKYKVFFPQVDLKKKTIDERETYVFSAINSAKLMLVFGCSYDSFNSFSAKNNWSRFINLMHSDKDKFLISCYKDIDSYDIPKEFAGLISQNMGENNAVEKLIAEIDKLPWMETVSKEDEVSPKESFAANPQALLKRGFMELSDGDYVKAEEFFEQVLNVDAESGHAYWGKLLVEYEARSMEELAEKIVHKIECDKVTKHISVEMPKASEIARGVVQDVAFLNGFTDAELDEMFSNINLDAEYDVAIDYYDKIIKRWNEYSVQSIASSKNYDRAVIYGDNDIKSKMEMLNNEILSLIKVLLDKENVFGTAELIKKNAETMIRNQIELCEKKYSQIKQLDEETLDINEENKAFFDKKYHELVKMMFVILNLKVGDSFEFGTYPYGANGELKPVEWKVIAVEKEKMLIISDKAIDAMPYNTDNEPTTWEQCALRRFINGKMYETLLDRYEKMFVYRVRNNNTGNPTYGTKGGRDTNDWLFLLDIEEAYKYLPDKADRSIKPTPYVKSKGIFTNRKTGNIWWWLRSPGYSNRGATIVHFDGRIDEYGDKATWEQSVIRPACWIHIAKLED